MTVEIHRGSALASLSLTPLIDVVFLLLIFFLVATRFDREEREMPVNLPAASEARPLTMRPQEVIINIDAAGGYYVGGQPSEFDDVERVLQRAVEQQRAHQMVLIRADRQVPLEFVVAVINLCNQLELDYRLGTQGTQP